MKKFIYQQLTNLRKLVIHKYSDLYKEFNRVYKNCKINKKTEITVLSPTTAGVVSHWVVDSVLDKGLSYQGVKIIRGICDFTFPICDTQLRRIYYPETEQIQSLLRCIHCKQTNDIIGKFSKANCIFYSEYISYDVKNRVQQALKDINIEEFINSDEFIYQGINIKSALFATIKGFSRGANMPLKFIRQFIETALLSIEIFSKMYEKIKPDYILIFNGRRSTENIALQVAKKYNIRTITYEVGQIFDRLIFDNDRPVVSFQKVSDLWPKYKDIPLNDNQNQLIDEFLIERTKGNIQRSFSLTCYENSKNPDNQERLQEIIKILDIDKSKEIALMAPNVIWDSGMVGCEVVFDGIKEWVVETVRYYINNPDKQLIIRPHPAEKVKNRAEITTLYTIESLLNDNFTDLPENIKFVPYDSNITSYELANISNYVLVYNSTIAIELAIYNHPVITCTNIFYADKEFTYQMNNKDEYFDFLTNSQKRFVPIDNQTEFARRLLYCYLYRFGVHFPFYKLGKPVTDFNKMKFAFKSYKELQKHDVFKKLKQYIVGETDYLN